MSEQTVEELIADAKANVESAASATTGKFAERIRAGEVADDRLRLLVKLADALKAVSAERDELQQAITELEPSSAPNQSTGTEGASMNTIEQEARAESDKRGWNGEFSYESSGIRYRIDATEAFEKGYIAGASREATDERDAVIEKVRHLAELDRKCPACSGYEAILKALTAPADALRKHDRQVEIAVIEKLAALIEPEGDPELCTTIYDPYDVADWLHEQVQKLREAEHE